ncbi:hypothetical protein ACQPZF_20710 [Actinosynnema sp. CS-041913]|uniref:hypothetical protein n=1 Tax=Actinosynnema sp. CS-041913 TaxID=3239917 RepID=UPI003D8CDA8E
MRPDLTRSDVDLVLVAPFDATFDPRPEGLLADYRLAGSGDVVTYSQWSGSPDVDGFVAYRRYRSTGLRDAAAEPGCVVLVSVEFERPGVAEQWVDLVFEALAAEEEPHPGGISGHFHISTDGLRVLNYAEWTSAAAHIDAVSRGNGSVGVSEVWQRVHAFPGLKSSDVRRYRPPGR